MKFNLNDYKGKYVMHCKTKEEAESFCRFLHQNGRRWCNGDSYLDPNSWDFYKIDTVYCFNEGMYDNIDYAKWIAGYTILEWSDFMEKGDSEFTQDIIGVLGQLLDKVELPDELHEQVYDLYKRATKLL